MVQGGDPLTKDPAKRALYGTGGLNAVKAEARAPKMTRGSVAAVLVPGKPDSAGAQFFIVLADQPALDGQYTVFGQVSDGMEVLQKISETPVDDKGVVDRAHRDPARDDPRHAAPEPFVTETPQELGAYRAVLDTSAGPITIEFFTDKAPDTVRQFMRLAAGGRLRRHGVPPRRARVRHSDRRARRAGRCRSPRSSRSSCTTCAPEFNDTKHVKGIVSMARGDEPASATTSFFICHRDRRARSTACTRRSGASWTAWRPSRPSRRRRATGETPNTRIELKTVRIERSRAHSSDPLSRLIATDRPLRTRRRHDPRDPHRDADQILDLNAVARLELLADDRFRADAGDVDLAIGILDVGEEHVPRHLAVDAHRLNLLQNAVAGPF